MLVREVEDGPHNGMIKVGHSIDPVNRPEQYQTGNWRELRLALIIPGGLPLEREFKAAFERVKVSSGGDEWYKVSQEVKDWLYLQLDRQLTAQSFVCVKEFGGPINIPKVELGEANAPLPRAMASISSVQSFQVSEAHPPKNPYAKVR